MAGLGGRPKNLWLAKIVTFHSPQQARQASRKMDQLYHKAKDMRGKILLMRSADLAYRRADANARSRNASPQRRTEMRQVAQAYGALLNRHKNQVDWSAPRSNPKISRSYYRGGIR